MARNILDFRAATLDIAANPGADVTWRVQITDEGITVGTLTVAVGGQTPTVDTSLSTTGLLIADITLTDTQTTTLGSGSYTWSFSNTVAGATTKWVVGNVTLTTTGNSSSGLAASITATTGVATVQALVSSGAATALASHLSELSGAGVSDETLKDWVAGEAYQLTAITRNANEVPTTATVLWPDATAGTFTSTVINVSFPAVDAFTVSHTASGKTVTQPTVTRNSAGAVTVKPALTVA